MSVKQQPNLVLYTPEREDRVAAALRENLRKRKAQQQTRRAESAPENAIVNAKD